MSQQQTNSLLEQADWDKGQGLLPAIVQDANTAQVLMLAYMNAAALEATLTQGWVTFYSRSRQSLWTKGETSGNRLALVDIKLDCDRDTFLIQARRQGPVCHTGTRNCWFQESPGGIGFLAELSDIIRQRAEASDESSYTARLLAAGLPRIAQKVGEEGVETALAAVTEDDQALTGEAADLVYHLLVLLQSRNISLQQLVDELAARHQHTSSKS